METLKIQGNEFDYRDLNLFKAAGWAVKSNTSIKNYIENWTPGKVFEIAKDGKTLTPARLSPMTEEEIEYQEYIEDCNRRQIEPLSINDYFNK